MRRKNRVLGFLRDRGLALPVHPPELEPQVQGTDVKESPNSCTISTMIDKELLAILVCPECKVSVIPKGEALKCPRCRRVYPIQDNIPIMLLDEAKIDSE